MVDKEEKHRRKVLLAAEQQRREALCAVENERLKVIEEECRATLEAQAQVEHKLKLKEEAELLSGPEAILYGQIQAMLTVFAYGKPISDLSYTFEFTVAPKRASIDTAIQKMLEDDAKSIWTTQLGNPDKELRVRWKNGYFSK